MLNTDEKIKTCLSNIDLWIEKLMKIREVEERKNNLGAIVMFGGEPTVNPKAIEIICKHLEENHKDKRQFLRITMTTNGTIYNEQITSNLFKAFNKKVGIMVSCDGSETESDLNRKFKSDNTSVFKKVQLNIEKYKKDKNVYNLLLASVHTEEHEEDDYFKEIKNSVEEKSKQDKEYRRRRFVEFHKDKDCLTNPEVKKTLKKFAESFYKNGKYVIENMTTSNKEKSASLLKETFRLCAASTGVHSCAYTKAIDAKGNFNFCNANSNLPNGEYNPEKMKDYILNLDIQEDLYDCSKNNKILSNMFRIKKQRMLAVLLEEKYTINYSLPSITVSDNIVDEFIVENLNNFIRFSTQDFFLVNEEARKYFKDQVVLKKIVFLKEIDPLSVNVKEDGKCFINIFENVELT
ncbi:MAG: radical SAM protein, partial [Fusobacteriaceae bacterium]